MKILHIISQAPDFTGSGKFIQEIIRQGTQNGHENFLLAGVQADFELPDTLIAKDHCSFVKFNGKDLAYPIPGMSDVMPYQSSIFSSLCEADMLAYQKAFHKKIQAAIDRFTPDILHTHHLWVVSALAKSIAPEIPMVTTCHGTCLRQHYLCPDVGRKITKDLGILMRKSHLFVLPSFFEGLPLVLMKQWPVDAGLLLRHCLGQRKFWAQMRPCV